jgi:hypothetical protein
MARSEWRRGGAVNDFLTAYLRTLYALRGGRLSASDAMNHVIDLMSGAQKAKTAFVTLLGFGGRAAGASHRG